MFTHRDGCASTPETDWRTAEWTDAFPSSCYSLYRTNPLPLDQAHTFYIFLHQILSLQTTKNSCVDQRALLSRAATYTKKHWRKDGARLFHRDLKELSKASIDRQRERESHQIVMATESPISFVSLHQLSFRYTSIPFSVYVIARLAVGLNSCIT